MLGLVGPTAVGKSAIAIALAKHLNGEIISCDSMQIYKGMDIGTAKPSLEIRQSVAHHLLDLLQPSEEFSCAQFRQLAKQVIDDMHSRGRVPIVVGGTGLYLRALLDGIFPGVSAQAILRDHLIQEANEHGPSTLYQRLKRCDPQAAQKIHPNDVRRIVRAIEVFEATGEPISRWWTRREPLDDRYEVRLFGLVRPRIELYRRIDQRVDQMFQAGLIEETRQVLASSPSKTALQALGYKEVVRFLKGEMGLDEAIRLVKRNTHRYARRQLTWFRKDQRIQWIELDDDEAPRETAEKIRDTLRFGFEDVPRC